ncbi:hypothetical protein JHK87_031906 [Glycine soja]|nr:hypothetical protein JHK87_031906 [Glycine soja]
MGENSKTVRLGILGCANIARKVARAIGLSPNATLCAIANRSKEKAEKFAAENGFPASVRVYGSYDQVLEDPGVDAVYFPLPTSLHVRWAVMAANKKKHVLVEKPVALEVAELDRILEAVESNGVQFMDCSMWLHHPRTAHIQDLLFSVPLSAKNSIGPVRFLDGLGALGGLAWYCIGASLWAKGYQLPTSGTALPDSTRNDVGVILSITASLLWDQPNQTLATIHCSFLSHSSMDLAICGSNGFLQLRDFIIPYGKTSVLHSTSHLVLSLLIFTLGGM